MKISSQSKFPSFVRNKSTQDIRKVGESRSSLPLLSCKIGSLHSFLSIEEFRKGLQSLPEEAKYRSEVIQRKRTRKLYLTMNEELSSTSKKEALNNFPGQDDQGDSTDEIKKLLYDKHIINRQKAAQNICKAIVEEVKQQFGYSDHAEESEKAETRSDTSNQGDLDIRKLIKTAEKCPSLIEKFDKISDISHKFFEQSAKNNQKKNTVANELQPREKEETKSPESSAPRFSKSKDKITKEDMYTAQINLNELFLEEPILLSLSKGKNSESLSNLITSLGKNNENFVLFLQKCLDSVSSRQKVARMRKPIVSLNKNCISLPDSKIDGKVCLFICYYYNSFRHLMKLDLSGNQIGDRQGSILIEVLLENSTGLEMLDLSCCGLGILTAQSLQAYLSSPITHLQSVRIESNLFMDEGICVIALGLLVNCSIVYLNISACGIELASGMALAKVLRINRVLKGLTLTNSMVSGKAIREITRSLIVNNEIVSVNFSCCQLIDEDIKEIAHMLNSNCKLQQLVLLQNSITHKGLEYLKYGLQKNKTLTHLGISGNNEIRLKALEKLKHDLLKFVYVDICKEDDFFKSNEAKKYKLIDYIR